MTELEIRAAIEDALRSYCRGIDRLHAPSIAAAFHPGAVLIDYGAEPSTIEVFVQNVIAALAGRFSATQHRISNITAQITGDKALVETYVLAYHVDETGDERVLHTFSGRYIDRFERREGRWAIAARACLIEWHGALGELPIPPEALAAYAAVGASSRELTDKSYQRPLRVRSHAG